jgi:hypothetical protein
LDGVNDSVAWEEDEDAEEEEKKRRKETIDEQEM